jgi:hypothetical protein
VEDFTVQINQVLINHLLLLDKITRQHYLVNNRIITQFLEDKQNKQLSNLVKLQHLLDLVRLQLLVRAHLINLHLQVYLVRLNHHLASHKNSNRLQFLVNNNKLKINSVNPKLHFSAKPHNSRHNLSQQVEVCSVNKQVLSHLAVFLDSRLNNNSPSSNLAALDCLVNKIKFLSSHQLEEDFLEAQIHKEVDYLVKILHSSHQQEEVSLVNRLSKTKAQDFLDNQLNSLLLHLEVDFLVKTKILKMLVEDSLEQNQHSQLQVVCLEIKIHLHLEDSLEVVHKQNQLEVVCLVQQLNKTQHRVVYLVNKAILNNKMVEDSSEVQQNLLGDSLVNNQLFKIQVEDFLDLNQHRQLRVGYFLSSNKLVYLEVLHKLVYLEVLGKLVLPDKAYLVLVLNQFNNHLSSSSNK